MLSKFQTWRLVCLTSLIWLLKYLSFREEVRQLRAERVLLRSFCRASTFEEIATDFVTVTGIHSEWRDYSLQHYPLIIVHPHARLRRAWDRDLLRACRHLVAMVATPAFQQKCSDHLRSLVLIPTDTDALRNSQADVVFELRYHAPSLTVPSARFIKLTFIDTNSPPLLAIAPRWLYDALSIATDGRVSAASIPPSPQEFADASQLWEPYMPSTYSRFSDALAAVRLLA